MTDYRNIWVCDACHREFKPNEKECPCWKDIDENVWYCNDCGKKLEGDEDCPCWGNSNKKTGFELFSEVKKIIFIRKNPDLTDKKLQKKIEKAWNNLTDERRLFFEQKAKE